MANQTITRQADSGQDAAQDARSRSRRSDAYDARALLWPWTKLERLRSCGRWSVREDGSVAVRVSGSDDRRQAGYAGIATCGSVWACPVCARKIASERQREIDQAVEKWRTIGGAVAMGTFTVSHRQHMPLVAVWDAVTDGWGRVTSGKAWNANKARYGVEYWTRTIEVTYTDNGWHVHAHVLFFLHHELTAVELERLRTALWGRWNAGIGKRGFSSSQTRGADLRAVRDAAEARSMGDYFNKHVYELADGQRHGQAVALELARGDLKSGRNGSRTPFQLLRSVLVDGDEEARELWGEWETGSKGRRQTAWSKGAREFFRIVERTDEEIAAAEVGSAVDDVVILPRETVEATRYMRQTLLDVAEVDGPEGLRLWLDGNALPWHVPRLRLTA